MCMITHQGTSIFANKTCFLKDHAVIYYDEYPWGQEVPAEGQGPHGY